MTIVLDPKPVPLPPKPLDSSEYQQYIQSKAWYRVRQRYLASSLPKSCYVCAKKYEKGFHFHHLHYKRLGCELLIDIVPCCQPCHEKIHKRQRDHIKYLEEQKQISLIAHNRSEVDNLVKQINESKMSVEAFTEAERVIAKKCAYNAKVEGNKATKKAGRKLEVKARLKAEKIARRISKPYVANKIKPLSDEQYQRNRRILAFTEDKSQPRNDS